MFFTGSVGILKKKDCMIRRAWCVLLTAVSFFVPGEVWSWGSVGHKFINQNAVQHLPPGMAQLAAQQVFLTNHASDADTRKSTDPSEEPKHFIDLESFSDFQHLPNDFSLVVAQYGWPALQTNGTLPWTIVTTVDSLTAQFRRADWDRAYQSAADLGHYVGDSYQPLHCTVNYNGQLTQNSGIHSRYETTMLGQFQSSLSVHPDTLRFVGDVYALALSIVLHSNTYVDSILQGDNAARLASGWNGSGTVPQLYYTTLWNRTGRLTQEVLQNATRDLASLWYTAWANAGVTSVALAEHHPASSFSFALEQNYPNPFNPSTKIGYRVSGLGSSWVKLSVYDILGREVAVLVDESETPGDYAVHFNGQSLTSGTYFYRLQITDHGLANSETKRMMLTR
jgi:hypothetical protein